MSARPDLLRGVRRTRRRSTRDTDRHHRRSGHPARVHTAGTPSSSFARASPSHPFQTALPVCLRCSRVCAKGVVSAQDVRERANAKGERRSESDREDVRGAASPPHHLHTRFTRAPCPSEILVLESSGGSETDDVHSHSRSTCIVRRVRGPGIPRIHADACEQRGGDMRSRSCGRRHRDSAAPSCEQRDHRRGVRAHRLHPSRLGKEVPPSPLSRRTRPLHPRGLVRCCGTEYVDMASRALTLSGGPLGMSHPSEQL